MAKEKEPKAHQLYKQMGYGTIQYGDTITPGEASTDTAIGAGWEILTDPTALFHHAVNRQYIDLSAWAIQELTTFTQGIDIQNQFLPQYTGVIPNVWIVDYISTRRLTDDELTKLGTNGSLPGFAGNTGDLMEIIYGQSIQLAVNAQVSLTYVQVGGSPFGSGNPTAMNKMHWTRHIICPGAAPGANLILYPTNLIVQALTVEEKDLVWMERLRRSYVLQNPADVV